MLIKPRSTGFLVIAITSLSAFAVMIITAFLTFIPSIVDVARDVGQIAMIVCGVFGYWASCIAQSGESSE